MKNIPKLALALLIVLLAFSCGPDEEFCTDETNPTCPNFDPCTRVEPANSSFKILAIVREGLGDTIINIEVDSASSSSPIEYRADYPTEMASYAWRVGADPRTFTGPELTLNFTTFTGEVDVTLTTTATNDLLCLREDQLMDVQTKSISYITNFSTFSTLGTFVGHLTDDVDQQEYTVRVTSNSVLRNIRLHGLPVPSDCDFSALGIPVNSGYQFFISNFRNDGPRDRCRNLTVVGCINLEDSEEIRIEYVYDGDDGGKETRTFVGRRQ